MLVQELERGLLRGDENPGNHLVLEELRRAIRAEAKPVPRIGDAGACATHSPLSVPTNGRKATLTRPTRGSSS